MEDRELNGGYAADAGRAPDVREICDCASLIASRMRSKGSAPLGRSLRPAMMARTRSKSLPEDLMVAPDNSSVRDRGAGDSGDSSAGFKWA